MNAETIYTTCPKCNAKGMRNVYQFMCGFYIDVIRHTFCRKCQFEAVAGLTYGPDFQAALLKARKLLAHSAR
jgi:hypothetical protein